MVQLVLPKILSQQPQQLPAINWDNPIARALISVTWVGPGGPRDILNPQLKFTSAGGTTPANLYYDAGSDGYGLRHTAVGIEGVYGERATFGNSVKQPPITITFVGNIPPDPTTGSAANFCSFGGAGGFSGVGFRYTYGYIQVIVNAATNGAANEATVSTRNAKVVAATFNETGSIRLHVNGKQVASGTFVAPINFNDPYGKNGIFGDNSNDGTVAAAGLAYFTAMWGRVLTDSELCSFNDNPWQIFKASKRTVLLPTIASATVAPITAAKLRKKIAVTRVQPQQTPQLDTTNPLMTGLVSLLWIGPGKQFDLLSPSDTFTASPALARTAGKNGFGFTNIEGTTGIVGNRGAFGNAAIQVPLTLMVVGDNFNSINDNRRIGGIGEGFWGGYAISASYGLARATMAAGTNGGADHIATVPWANGAIGISVDLNNMNMFSGGKIIDTSPLPTNSTISYDTGYGRIRIFGDEYENVVGASGTVYYQAVWNRALNASEILSLYQNPWQLFKQQHRIPAYVVASTLPTDTVISAQGTANSIAVTAGIGRAIRTEIGSTSGLAVVNAATVLIRVTNATSIADASMLVMSGAVLTTIGVSLGTSTSAGSTEPVGPTTGSISASSFAVATAAGIIESTLMINGFATTAGVGGMLTIVNASVAANSSTSATARGIRVTSGNIIAIASTSTTANALSVSSGSIGGIATAVTVARSFGVSTGAIVGLAATSVNAIALIPAKGSSVSSAAMNPQSTFTTAADGSYLAAKTISVILHSASGVLQPNLSGLNWRWSDVRGTIIDRGTNASTDMFGVLTLNVNTNLPTGSNGYLEVDNSDGTVNSVYRAAHHSNIPISSKPA